MTLTYRKAQNEDSSLLIDIYNAAFYDDYKHYGECPAYGRTKEQMELSIANSPKYIILNGDIPVGVISYQHKGNGEYYLGCLCVIPKYQGTGIGTMAFQYLLLLCHDWKRITLITPSDKEQNIKFYTEKCGFYIGDRVMDGNVEVIQFYMER
ncbi:GNAT family N-acetyltransferase [Clostridium sp. E02]|uniref:GNAT family N-acetyltransferase n=1 Tax=Clostridium sp. E02 TaxID=2487134 RepID=UPI000F52D28D|nr:GNAT family N-acetyltransferase [Clostridium sp. E02]